MTKLEVCMKDLQELIDKALDKFLPPADTEPKIIHEAMRYSVYSGGKRIRPILVMEACRTCAAAGSSRGGAGSKDALVMACAVEMVHAYSLIHDDLPSMDDDDYRRGKFTCHKVFGEANAILAGDALQTLAFNILAKHLEPKKGIRAIKELADASGTYGMVGGQAIDMACKGKSINYKKQNYINSLKTARLFEASAKLGAIASGASGSQIRAMANFGASMGAAFQIVDDIMDNESYVKPLSKRKARRDAEYVTAKALGALKVFGRKADMLKEIAGHLLKRHI